MYELPKDVFKKFKDNYKIGSLYKLIEWRCSKSDLDIEASLQPLSSEYVTIIDVNKVYIFPCACLSMQRNSELLTAHLRNILSLNNSNMSTELSNDAMDTSRLILNDEIIEIAHDLPFFVSIDRSLKDGFAKVSVSIIILDVLDLDIDMEWQMRLSKVFIMRSWRLPRHWGTGETCINMAEAMDFIIGEYTIPADMPIIYITDSSNAHMQNGETFTHCKMIQCNKQGIDHSLANHLEYLTAKWPREEHLSNREFSSPPPLMVNMP